MKLPFIFCALVLLQLCHSVLPVYPQAPTTAKISFTSNRHGNWEIYVMNPDGSEPVRLFRHPASDGAPIWAPDGKQILFNSNRDGAWDLYIMDADGTHVRKVFEETARRTSGTWSPDGKHIAYTRNLTVYIATRNGQHVEEVTKGFSSAWSPNGKWIAFILDPPGEAGKYGIGIFDLRTRTRKMVLENPRRPFITAVDWSPDSSKLAFSWFNPERFHLKTVYAINIDGSEVKRVTKPARGFYADTPVWSPYGDELLYEHRADPKSQIFKISLGSRQPKQLTKAARNYLSDWFDPAALPVPPQATRLTTLWGELKRN